MRLLNQEKDEAWFKFLVYGKSGTGKSTLGTTAPDPVILLSERQGWDAIRDAARRQRRPTPPTFFIEHKDDLIVALRALYADGDVLPLLVRALVNAEYHREKGVEPTKEQLRALVEPTIKTLPYLRPKTVVIDSVTDFFRLIADQIDEQSPPKIAKDGLPQKSDRYWNVLRERGERMIREFRDMPYHVLFLALLDDRETGEGEQKTRSIQPQAPMRALPNALMAAVNVVGISSVQVMLRKDEEALLRRWVRFAGPDWMCTKPRRPLRDVEVPDVGSWINRLLNTNADDSPLDLGQGVPTEEELADPSVAPGRGRGGETQEQADAPQGNGEAGDTEAPSGRRGGTRSRTRGYGRGSAAQSGEEG